MGLNSTGPYPFTNIPPQGDWEEKIKEKPFPEWDSRAKMREAGEETIRLCCGPRNADYGPPEDNHARAAQFKAIWRQHMKNAESPDSFDECIEMICTKLGRLCHERKRDSLIDIAGYAFNAIACLES